MSLTIDVSVFISAALPSEVQFNDSDSFLNKIRMRPQILHCPTLITWDAEMLTRGVRAVPVLTPSDWLAAKPTN